MNNGNTTLVTERLLPQGALCWDARVHDSGFSREQIISVSHREFQMRRDLVSDFHGVIHQLNTYREVSLFIRHK